MEIVENEIIFDNNDVKNNFKKLKKYKNTKLKIQNKSDDNIIKEFIKIFNEKDINNRYNYIYDFMCNYLDANVCSLCDFKNDRCKGNRNGTSVHQKDGCCYFRNEGFCTLFKNKKCTNPNISCKLFMCELIEKEMGFKSLPQNYLLLDFFFNKRQKKLLQRSYRVPKEITMQKLLEMEEK